MRAIAIDVRLMWASGIGAYIRNLVPRVIKSLPGMRFYLMGVPEEMKRLEAFRRDNAIWIRLSSRLFSLREQVEMISKVPPDTEIFWSPHYVFPVFWPKKLLVTVHDTLHLTMGWQVPGIHRRLYAQMMFSRLASRADRVLTVSNFTKDELIRWTKAVPEKIIVTPNGLDPAWFEVERKEMPHPRTYLLYVGIVKPHKNLSRLLDAFKMMKDRIDQDLVLVGKKEGFIVEDKKILKKVAEFGNRVKFTGHVDEDKLKQYYAFADLFVFPSLYEGFGFPPLEAMACGIPTAVSRAASMPEVCGDAAHYFNPLDPRDMADKISEVLQAGPLRDELRSRGLERARVFTWESCADKTCRAIESLLG